MSTGRTRGAVALAQAAIVLSLFLLWEAASRLGWADARLLPPPSLVLPRAAALLSDLVFLGHLWITVQEVLLAATEAGLVLDAVLPSSGPQRDALWELRHSVSEANKLAGVGLTTDCAVPISAVAAFIELATAAVRRLVPGLEVLVVAHLGDGNVHFIPFFDWAQWEATDDRDALGQRLKHAVNEVSHALRGTFSAEHGIGRTLIPEMAHFKSPVELSMMQLLKRQFDPLNLFNPGRLVPGVA